MVSYRRLHPTFSSGAGGGCGRVVSGRRSVGALEAVSAADEGFNARRPAAATAADLVGVDDLYTRAGMMAYLEHEEPAGARSGSRRGVRRADPAQGGRSVGGRRATASGFWRERAARDNPAGPTAIRGLLR